MHVEAATISQIDVSQDYPFVRVVHFKDRKYTVVLASTKNYSVGDEVLFIPGDARLPEWFLKYTGFWDYKANTGLLWGKENNTVIYYNYAKDDRYFSYGMFVQIPGNKLTMPSGEVVDIHDSRIGDRIGITYLTHKIPNYLKGDYFIMNLPTHRMHVPDLEEVYQLFENEEVQYEQWVNGRRFYASIIPHKMHHQALGPSHNIFVTSNLYSNHAYLARAKYNTRECVVVTLLNNYHIVEDLTQYTHANPKHAHMTLEFIMIDYAFVAKYQLKKTLLCLTDVYVGTDPFGRYMNVEEKAAFSKRMNLYAPTIYGRGIFSYEDAQRYLADNQGIIIRSTDNSKRAVLYSHEQRLKRKNVLH